VVVEVGLVGIGGKWTILGGGGNTNGVRVELTVTNSVSAYLDASLNWFRKIREEVIAGQSLDRIDRGQMSVPIRIKPLHVRHVDREGPGRAVNPRNVVTCGRR